MDVQNGDDNNALDRDDPFAQHAVTHPALRATHDLSSDIYRLLFDWFFDTLEFEQWVKRRTTRQLYCTAGPGSGKTTLTALMAARIRRLFTAAGCDVFVATVYIHQHVVGNDLAFLEDFLQSVFAQLAPVGAPIWPQTSKFHDQYTEACRVGKRAAARIDLISKAVNAQLCEPQLRRSGFLLVDGLDQCTPSLQQLLERELTAMQQAGLQIMVASRLPAYERTVEYYCDFHEPGLYEVSLLLSWQCMICEESIICQPCKEDGKLCNNCGSDTLWEEPKYLYVSINSIPYDIMKDFVAWDLEREHGDVGLESGCKAKPPLSALGMSFLEGKAGTTAHGWVKRITDEAHGSIALLKLGLDRVHRAASVDAIEFTSPDRLPRNVQAMFEESLQAIQAQPITQRDLALKTIAAVGADALDSTGTPVSLVEKALRERPDTSEQTHVPPRSVEDILQVTRGFLRIEPPWEFETEYKIAVYNFPFALYVIDGYNEELIWANAQLRATNVPRSLTRKLTENEGHNEPEMTREDILGNLRKFHVESSPSLNPSQSPMQRRTSPLLRSNTGIAPGASRRKRLPVGLGLNM